MGTKTVSVVPGADLVVEEEGEEVEEEEEEQRGGCASRQANHVERAGATSHEGGSKRVCVRLVCVRTWRFSSSRTTTDTCNAELRLIYCRTWTYNSGWSAVLEGRPTRATPPPPSTHEYEDPSDQEAEDAAGAVVGRTGRAA